MARASLALRFILPAVWLGLIIGISFIEAPLKFQAPGITIPLGLGIGRLVFGAMNLTALAILAVLTLASIRPRPTRAQIGVLAGLWVVLLAEILVIRPPLNARTDQVLAGTDEGGSIWHYLYIAADGALVVLLIVFLVLTARRIIPAVPLTAPTREAAQK
jgi:hypothetical protein